MIKYEAGYLGVSPTMLLKLSGSVVPKACLWAIPITGIAILLFELAWGGEDAAASSTVSQVWMGYSFILAFLIIYRMQQAYTRFWEAATLTNELRCEWIDAFQSLCAFCSEKPEKKAEVELFQHTVARLLSMLHRSSLERLNIDDSKEFPILDNTGMSKLDYLENIPDRCEVIYQWVLRLITINSKNGVLDIPPPILGRCYSEVSQGIAKLHNVMKITTIPIPFPYVQMTVFLLLFHCMLTPIIASLIMHNWRWCGCLAFMSVFCLWAIYYIAMDVEVPFGSHKNALPCLEMQNDMNRILCMLLKKHMQEPLAYDWTPAERELKLKWGRNGSVPEDEVRARRVSLQIFNEEEADGTNAFGFAASSKKSTVSKGTSGIL
mmetsp:Transcript_151798/g.268013  ORF Transcript_151798/g.268013 Transcript_151798/m.268013 type:complete len:378 (-) Transcript_151798:108-1241(-)